MIRSIVLLILSGCGTSSRPATDADADADADADTDADADADADLDCSALGGPAGTVNMQGCGPPNPTPDLPLCLDEIAGCVRDEQCAIVNFDDCCGMEATAVIEPAVAAVSARIEVCNVTDPGCPDCPVAPSEARCLEGRCSLEACMGPCGP